MTAPGAFCLSIDLEMAWGYWDALTPEILRNCRELERPIARGLIALFEKYDIPATWAVVGRLLEKPDDGKPLPGGEEAWYAPDVVEAIRAAKTPQEIGSHGFAHLYYTECGRDAAREDLARAKAVHARHGLAFETFIFPRTEIAHLDAVAEAGLRVYRSADRDWPARVRAASRLAGRAANLLDKSLPFPPPVGFARAAEFGLIDVPPSMLLMRRDGPRRFVSVRATELKARLGLGRAAASGGIFHLWFHPDSFYYRMDAQFEALEKIVSAAAELRRRGALEILPMNLLARRALKP